MKKKKLRTRAEAREWLQAQGLTAAAWARTNNFPVRVVQELLRDRAKGNYGVAHDIAVALGIKEGEPTDERRTA
ncbi:DNA-binding protein [uncultured Desulfovibrio sp.]|uniref:DNA-binding protein n=1 Tax=uncultured Desulfovibrio sp. TaxID=167968 RepID=UPI002606FBA2|nr:DNA-binding protein [uncultured Desulfovibrio sp.]